VVALVVVVAAHRRPPLEARAHAMDVFAVERIDGRWKALS
jgi:hypothetical protein